MEFQIKDGTGTGNRAKVDSKKRLLTESQTTTKFENEVLLGNAYNVNTEFMTITTDVSHSLLYIKNEELSILTLDAWFIGTDLGTNGANLGLLEVYYNPTGGTIISGGTALTLVNRLGGSSNVSSITALKGGEGFTATGLTTPVLYQTQSVGSRVFGNVRLALESKGSLVVNYKPNGAEPINIYTGFQLYLNK
jgi:hypothetical protein